MNNVKGNDYVYMFFTWVDNDEYVWDAPTDELRAEDDFYHEQIQAAIEAGDHSAYHELCDHYDCNAIERERVWDYKLHPNKLRFWRFTLVNNCGSDQNRFDEEWPMSPELAFISSGSSLFAATTIQALRKKAKKATHGKMSPTGKFQPGQGHWRVFSTPKPGHTYIATSDSCAGGQGKKDDFAAVFIMDRVTQAEVAC